MGKKERQNKALETILKGGDPEQPIKIAVPGSSSSKYKVREIGETWTDSDGRTWEQRDGYIMKVPKMERFNMPMFCPECDKIMNKNLDDKMWARTGKCFDCVIKEETAMRAAGTYELYEKEKILANMKSWVKDMEAGLETFFENINNKTDVTSSGEINEWSDLTENELQELRSKFENEIKPAKEKINELQKTVDKLKKEIK